MVHLPYGRRNSSNDGKDKVTGAIFCEYLSAFLIYDYKLSAVALGSYYYRLQLYLSKKKQFLQ